MIIGTIAGKSVSFRYEQPADWSMPRRAAECNVNCNVHFSRYRFKRTTLLNASFVYVPYVYLEVVRWVVPRARQTGFIRQQMDVPVQSLKMSLKKLSLANCTNMRVFLDLFCIPMKLYGTWHGKQLMKFGAHCSSSSLRSRFSRNCTNSWNL